MNPLAILTLISDLFEQLKSATEQNTQLRAANAEQEKLIEQLRSENAIPGSDS